MNLSIPQSLLIAYRGVIRGRFRGSEIINALQDSTCEFRLSESVKFIGGMYLSSGSQPGTLPGVESCRASLISDP
jgi:hypothetical protein